MLKEGTVHLEKVYQKFNKIVPLLQQEYQKAFQNLYKVTNITKYRDFQYCLLVCNIYTNNKLYHWNIVNSKQCDYCELEKQMVTHLLYNCPVTLQKWEEFEVYVHSKMPQVNGTLEINCKNVILNLIHPKPMHVINFLALVLKQHIFAMKCMAEKVEFAEVLAKYKRLQNIERYNAGVTNCVRKHESKWAPLK